MLIQLALPLGFIYQNGLCSTLANESNHNSIQKIISANLSFKMLFLLFMIDFLGDFSNGLFSWSKYFLAIWIGWMQLFLVSSKIIFQDHGIKTFKRIEKAPSFFLKKSKFWCRKSRIKRAIISIEEVYLKFNDMWT